MYFNLKSAPIYKAVRFSRLFPAGLLRFFRIAFLLLGGAGAIISGFIWILNILPEGISIFSFYLELPFNFNFNNELFSGLTFLFLPLGFTIMFFEIFGHYHLRNPVGIVNKDNTAESLDFEAASIFARALSLSHSMDEKEISTDSLLLAILDESYARSTFMRLGIDPVTAKEGVKKLVKSNLSPLARISFFSGAANLSQSVKDLLNDAEKTRQLHGGDKITFLDIISSLFDFNGIFKQLIINAGLEKEDIMELSYWYEQELSFARHRKEFWQLDNLLRKPPIGKDWTYGYSWYLNHFANDLTDALAGADNGPELTGRRKEMDELEQILVRSGENNVLLVGREGVGTRNVILEFVRMINRGAALPSLNFKKVFELNLAAVSGIDDPAKIQNTLTKIFDEATRAGNIILIIENFHSFIGSKEGIGRIDVSEIIVPYLKSSHIQVIATTEPISFHKFIANRGELMNVFEKIDVEEPDIKITTRIVEEELPAIENRAGIMLTFGALKTVVEGADKFIKTQPFPEKAFDLLAEVVAYAATNSKRIVYADDVNAVISKKTSIPLGPIAGSEKDKLTNLEKLMHEEVVGQDRAVQVVASTMRRLRAGLARRGKPAGVFLFIGPTGVGKTMTSKILAKVYFGSEDKMIRFDMSEYQDIESLDRFLGSLRLNEPGHFVTKVMDNPFSLILLDEIEKAHKDILNIFLQVFDEGHLTDAFGRKISFDNNIIIATSNAGADLVRDMIRQGLDPSHEKDKITDALIKGGHFRPELLNRFDEIVIFHPLSKEQVAKISGLMLNSLSRRLREQGYEFRPTQELAQYVAEAGFEPQFGARPMQRVIQDKVESAIAKKILDGEVEKGKEFSVGIDELA